MSTSLVVLEYIKVLIWPVTVTFVAIAFRARIAALLTRMTKVEALGASASFEQAVAQAGAEPAATPRRVPELKWVVAHSYIDAREIGDTLRERGAVAVNLEEMDDADAKRLVDFMAGLIFRTNGRIDRLAARRFMLSSDVDT